MLRNCACRARGLSRFTSTRELSSLNAFVHSKGVIECNNEGLCDKIAMRSLSSTGSKQSQTNRRRMNGAKRPGRTNDKKQQPNKQNVSEKEGQSILNAIKNVSSKSTVTLDEAAKHISFLNQQLSQLPPLEPVWSTQTTPVDSATERQVIFQEAQALLGRIEATVNKQQLNPSGKHGRELSHLLGQILELYAKTAVPFQDGTSVFDACCEVMTLLGEWNLDIQPHNFACSVEAAARESRWKEASYLFWKQIDPEAHGHTPMEISSYLALGLYAVARNSQLEGGATVEHVMDAVLRMSMVCPTDQDHCKWITLRSCSILQSSSVETDIVVARTCVDVLSAGLALGHAGEGEAFADYLANSYHSLLLGQPLTAAVMNACVLSSHAEKALELFRKINDDPLSGDSEWQYGGQYNSMNPLSRDVAMRALGASTSENLSELALELYQKAKDDEYQISVDALCGVVQACEGDGRWKEAVEVLLEFLDGCHSEHWLVDGNDTMSIVSVEEARENDRSSSPDDVLRQARSQIGSMLASVMRACNADEKFGMAMLCCHLASDTLPSFVSFDNEAKDSELWDISTIILSRFGSQDELVAATMTSLCGLDSADDAVKLYSNAVDWFPSHEWYAAHDCSEYAQVGSGASGPVLPGPWQSAYRHIQLLTKACSLAEASRQDPTGDEIMMLSAAIASAMRACNAAGQPEAGLVLAKRADYAIAPRDDNSAAARFSLAKAVASFLGYKNTSSQESQAEEHSLLSDTNVFAETVSAYRIMNRPEEGLALLEQIPETVGSEQGTSNDARWIPVVNQAILLLADQNRVDDAYSLFNATNEAIRDHETFRGMATAFEKAGQWNEIVKLYYDAQNIGLLSEWLGVLAMKAVVKETSAREMPRQLRIIAKSLSELAGLEEKQWLASRYWKLEHSLGWNAARLLMWWDASTANEKKLLFAVDQIEARQRAGLKPKNSALRYVVNSIPMYKGPTEILPFSREQWLDLLLAVLAEAESSTLWNNPKFVESACTSLYWLGAHEKCLEFARSAMVRGVRISHATIGELAELAHEEGLENDDLLLMSSQVSR